MCEECMNAPCPVAKAAKSLLGAWARERRKQGAGLFGALSDQSGMTDAVDKPIKDLAGAGCFCSCHDSEGR